MGIRFKVVKKKATSLRANRFRAAIVCFNSIMVVLAASALSSCKVNAPATTTEATSTTNYDVILAHCFSPQGNGGNWASLLGWVSEEINLRVSEAKVLEAQGKKVGIYLGCMTGGSSGSVSTATLSALLSNNQLFPGKNAQSLFSAEEAEILVRAVRYVALSSDLNFGELAKFFGQAFRTAAMAYIDANKYVRKFEDWRGDSSPRWWTGAAVDAGPILIDFSTSLHLAATMTNDLLNEPIEEVLSGAELDLYRRENLRRITDFPKFKTIESMPREDSDQGKIMASAFAKQAKAIGVRADKFVAKQFQLGDYFSRHRVNLGPGEGDYLLKKTIEMPLSDGFCSIIMGRLSEDAASLKVTPHYKTLSPIAFCNEKTIQKIINSPLYRSQIEQSHPFASRFIYAVVPNIRGAIKPSIREPNMMRPLISPFGSGDLEVSKFYSPQWDLKKNGSITFELMDARSLTLEGKSVTPYLGVAGGFPDRRVTAWPASYFFVEVLNQSLKSMAPEVKTSFGMYGRENLKNSEAFHKVVVRSVFSETSAEGAESAKDWSEFIDSWCTTMGDSLVKNFNTKIENITVDWEVSKLPAAQTPGGLSKLLVTKSINATRSQAGSHLPDRAIVFDPAVSSPHVPKLAAPNTCREN
jgi:hypothetical protein